MTNVLNLVILKIDQQKKLLNDLESLKSSIKRTVLSELKESNERMNEREEEKIEPSVEVNISQDELLQ